LKLKIEGDAAPGKVAFLISPGFTDSSHGLGGSNGDLGHGLSVAIVDPEFERRGAVATIVHALRNSGKVPRVTPLSDVGDTQLLFNQGFDVVLIAVDHEKETALRTIETLCRTGSATPMAYSSRTHDDLLIRCMRAGVREFLLYPFATGVIEEAFSRMASRVQFAPDTRRAVGKSFVFLGAKGGSGVTTAACNFAVALAQEPNRSTLLIDLDLPLGDAALCLGVNSEFSTLDALREAERLDATFLNKLMSRHKSGLQVLAAPGRYLRLPFPGAAVNSLMNVASKTFDYVVVDAGSKWELTDTKLFDMVSTVFLVTQVGVAELRNSNRLITGCLQAHSSKLEIVLNRYTAEMFGIDDTAIESALTRPAQWRIPNDYPAVRRMQNTAEVAKESSVQKAIKKMAVSASGFMDDSQEKKKKFGIFGLSRA
jgi:pilus assembly protein CpaE